MTANIHPVKSITAMQDVRRKGNVRSRGCVQVAFITSDGVIKVSTLSPLLSTPPSFCLDTQRNVKGRGDAFIRSSKNFIEFRDL
ncbi:hypothetical protein PUN28_002006 [Cardiocondyla obscurior]|uniref:Ribosomal protein L14 n=1 Tax=Cardiocondyla obscurior TaxID=286306 RepID=A0AAW2GS29_9HYME